MIYVLDQGAALPMDAAFALLLLISCLLTLTIYFMMQKGTIITKDLLIDEILETTSNALGRTHYRLNVMIPSSHENWNQIVFQFRNYSKNYPPVRHYSGRLNANTQGVGTAFFDKSVAPAVFVTTADKVDTAVDSYPKRIYSIAIRRDQAPIAVLNIDTDLESVTQETDDHIKEVAINLAGTIAFFLIKS